MSYLDATRELYTAAALTPQPALCCAPGPRFQLPGLVIPAEMEAMNYGCGTTVHLQDLAPDLDVLYIGVGSGLEALQFACVTRRPASVIAVDSVPEMIERARLNFALAETTNPWFRSGFVDLREGDALALPLPDARVDLVAQNCLFNIFRAEDLDLALSEAHRVLKPGGRLVISDPISEQPIPDHLRADDRLRAECLSGAVTLDEYVARLTKAGFGTVEIRGRRPYRVLDRRRFGIERDLLLESVEMVAVKSPVAADGPCVFAGETVIYVGDEPMFDDGAGHVVTRDIPLGICRKTARWFRALGSEELVVTEPTWHYAGGGCC
ncbi:MAG: arsenosugar biosynthesis arsenite methyltransferase ArsM [Candidatus Eisenbacteria bacterium]